MSQWLVENILKGIKQAHELYYGLVLLVGPSGSGKTIVLQQIHERTGIPLININRELARRLLELNEKQRILQISPLLTDLIQTYPGDIVLLDNLEILFDISLKQDPLRLLLGLSRIKTIGAAWNGIIENNHVVYAMPDHPEYRRYELGNFLVFTPEI